MTEEMMNKKQDAAKFLSEQIRQLDQDQKARLAYVLFGANMANAILKKGQTHDRAGGQKGEKRE